MAMGTFTSDKVIIGSPKFIPQLAAKICQAFEEEEFETKSTKLASGSYDISLSKGGMFKAVIGMKSALKVTVEPRNGNVYVKAGIGIFGQQAIPTAITALLFWPVIIAQVWGMVQQSKLDNRVIEIAETEMARLTRLEQESVGTAPAQAEPAAPVIQSKFCPNCGNKIVEQGKFCVNCGEKLF